MGIIETMLAFPMRMHLMITEQKLWQVICTILVSLCIGKGRSRQNTA